MRIIYAKNVDFLIFIVYYIKQNLKATINKRGFQVNKKTKKKLNNRKKKIKKRIERKNWDEQSSPMFAGSNIHYDIDGRNNGIACGGIGVIQMLAQKLEAVSV
ncbi:Uncharacterized protein dnl_41660 [Desulfonema limicola]|uniref:Uncharacterized protein n=1 Tax=Desulfonema limicola TaxID=45656 RepID=A0A975BAW6_9BACT|nr:Uncharacterized protein dnl_41660 [Desulfonema limicola]